MCQQDDPSHLIPPRVAYLSLPLPRRSGFQSLGSRCRRKDSVKASTQAAVLPFSSSNPYRKDLDHEHETTTSGFGVMLAAFCVWAVRGRGRAARQHERTDDHGHAASVGETLTAQNGTWSNSPTAFQYQWQRCNASGAACANIAGATEKTYLLTPADAGRTMRVRVTGDQRRGRGQRAAQRRPTSSRRARLRGTRRGPSITGDPRGRAKS